MPYNVNIVVLSGVVGWVKDKYTSNGKLYLNFAVEQPLFVVEDGKIISKSIDYYFCSCFDEAIYKAGNIKVGVHVTVQGKLSAYKTKKGDTAYSVVVEKVDTHGFERNKE